MEYNKIGYCLHCLCEIKVAETRGMTLYTSHESATNSFNSAINAEGMSHVYAYLYNLCPYFAPGTYWSTAQIFRASSGIYFVGNIDLQLFAENHAKTTS